MVRFPCSLLVTAGFCVVVLGAHGGGTVRATDEKATPSPKELKTILMRAVSAQNASDLTEVLTRLASLKGREGAQVVLSVVQALPSKEEKLYWLLLEGLASFRAPQAFTEMGEFIARNKNGTIARDLLHALAKNTSKYKNRVIRRVLARGTLDLQLMALDQAQNLTVRRTVDVLLGFLEIEDGKDKGSSELKRRLSLALRALTGQSFGETFPNWQSWWAANRSRGLKIIREEADDSSSRTAVVDLDPMRSYDFVGLEDLPPGQVLVIKGATARNGNDTNFDHIEEMLDRLGVTHDVVIKDRLDESRFSLDRYAAVFINCSQINRFCQSPGHQAGGYAGKRLHQCLGPAPHDVFEGKFSHDAVRKIQSWVEKGGYLFTEDWVLVELLEIAFPKYVISGSKLEDSTVEIRPRRGQTTHPLLRGVFVPPVQLADLEWSSSELVGDDELREENAYDPTVEDDPGDVADSQGRTEVDVADDSSDPLDDISIDFGSHRWKIDRESPSLNIRSSRVTILIASDELKRLCGHPAVAVTFNPGRGRVVHVLSHFGKQSSRQDEATLENFLVNFLLEVKVKLEHRGVLRK